MENDAGAFRANWWEQIVYIGHLNIFQGCGRRARNEDHRSWEQSI